MALESGVQHLAALAEITLNLAKRQARKIKRAKKKKSLLLD